MSVKLSLIIPVFNAESFIDHILRSTLKWAKSVNYTVEVIWVNDGSLDGSKDKIERFIDEFGGCFKLLSYDKNKGKGFAVKEGMNEACGEYRVFTDADIPYGFEIIEKIIYYLDFKEFDVCVGNRKSMHSEYFAEISFLRKITSMIFTFFVSRFVVTGINDTQCGLKGFRANVADSLFPKLNINGFGFDVELLYLSYKKEYDIKRIPVSFEGNNNSTVNLAKDSFRMLIDIAILPFRYHFTKKYKTIQ